MSGYINGTPGDDTLVGGPDNEQITGGAGNDIMRGLGGVDLFFGGLGDDVYDGGDGDDYAYFYYAANAIRVDLAITAAQDTGEGRDTFISIEHLGGSNYDDVLSGDNGGNGISGRDGNDVIAGRGGNDGLFGDGGSDNIHGDAGDDSINGGDGNDTLFGDEGDDIFWASAGDDVIDGGVGSDTIVFVGWKKGIALDMAVTGRQEIAFLQYLTIKNVENIQATVYGDNIAGDGGNNLIAGEAGDDFIDGRGGYDTVRANGPASEFVVSWTVDGWRIADQKAGRDGVDMVKNVEWLQFGDGSGRLLGDGMAQVAASVLRTAPSSLIASLSDRLASGTLTATGALAEIIKAAGATTSVASLSYEFFTGKVPGQGGIDYLVSPTGPNANNLNSAYYQSFNLENRYINFAVNLGKVGEGKEAFAAKYGSLTLFDATREAYRTIFGAAPTDAQIHAMIDTRADYFAVYGGDGANGVGTKAAMVGWLLAEAQKADVGVMAKSNDAWLTDLASISSTPFGIDILDPAKGYYKADFIFGG